MSAVPQTNALPAADISNRLKRKMNRMRLPEKALVALDHTRTLGVLEGLGDPGKVLEALPCQGL
jgi:hypothetical protein